jgi:hypothetical protein
MAALLAPSLSYSQKPQAGDTLDAGAATTRPVEARAGDPATPAAAERRSLMGMVMDALIASAEQQSAREAASVHQAHDSRNANATRTAERAAAAAPAPAQPSSPSIRDSDLDPDPVTREQVAVESIP